MSGPAPEFGQRSEFYTFAPETLAQELPEFTIRREVGKGSMGIVYDAVRKQDQRRVALKVLPPSLTLTERALARFLREAELMEKVAHPAIVKALEHGRHGRLHYFVMEFVDGVTVEERVKNGPLPARRAAEIGAQVARALHFAHERGIVHRDIKPGNLMLREDGSVVITDFGLARETGTGSLTESGAIVGTPIYMPPEQVLGERGGVGTRSDVYGLGATLYQLVTGAAPFQAETAQGVLKAVLEHEPRPPSALQNDLPRELEAVILKAMEKEPGRRYGSALELAEDLERFLRDEPVLAPRRGSVHRALRALARHKFAVLGTLVLLALAIGAWQLHLERSRWHVATQLEEANSALLESAMPRDEHQRPRSEEQREQLARDAEALAADVIEQEPGEERAWYLRARARQRLRDHKGALSDLATFERLHGSPTEDLLYIRLFSLAGMHEPDSALRMQETVRALLGLEGAERGTTACAERLVAIAEEALSGPETLRLLELARTLVKGTDVQSVALHARIDAAIAGAAGSRPSGEGTNSAK